MPRTSISPNRMDRCAISRRATRSVPWSDTAPGQVTTYRFGVLLMALILNFGFLIVWFVCLWLLLRFQWSHALGLAFVAWLISLFILPMILTQAEKVRKENLPPPKTTATARQAVEPCGHSLFSHTAA